MSKEQASQGQDFQVTYLDRSNLGAEQSLLTTANVGGVPQLSLNNAVMALLSVGAAQLKSGAGAIDPASVVTKFTSTGAGNALTLANGSVAGQLKLVVHSTKGSSGTGVITPHSAGNFATATLTNHWDWVLMMWNGSSWDALAAAASVLA